MQSAQNSIYLQPDCRDFRDHPWAGCGFIVSVSLTTVLLAVSKQRDHCLYSSFAVYCLPGHKHINKSGQVDILALCGRQLLC